MKILVLIAILVLLAGCKTTTFTKESPDGSKVTAADSRFLMGTAAQMDATVNTNGTWTIKAGVTSAPDKEAMAILFEVLLRAAAKSAVPVP